MLLVLLLGASASVAAQDAEADAPPPLWSESQAIDPTVPAEQAPGEDQTAAEAMAAEARAQEMQRLRETAATLEARLASAGNEQGMYDLSLAEIQTDLGRIYAELGDHDKAVDLLTQALHLVRLNSGLYDAQQIDVLEELIDALTANQDWEKVDDYQHLVFSLQKRLYEPDSAEFADAVLAMGGWQLSSGQFDRIQGFQVLSRLGELKDLYASQLEYARAREDLGRQWSFIYAQAMTDIVMARQYLRSDVAELMVPAQRYVTQTRCRDVPNSAGGYSRVCWQETVSNPDYYYQLNNERRSQLERARLSLNGARRELQEMLDNNPEFASANAEDTRIGLENLDQALTDLQRNSRMSMLGNW